MSTFDTFNTFNYPSIFSEATAMLGAALRTNGFELSQRYRYKEKKRVRESPGSLAGRKAAGVEPTRERLTPPTGFEAQPHHRIRMPSCDCYKSSRTDEYVAQQY